MPLKGYIRDRVYLPVDGINTKALREYYDKSLYDEKLCRGCPNLEERHCEACDGCAAFKGKFRLFKPVLIKGERYVGLPSSSIDRVIERLGFRGRLIDDRVDIPFTSGLKFTGILYDGTPHPDGTPTNNQKKLTSTWLKSVDNGGGIMRMPPRGGKTYCAVNVTCRLRQKTVIFASQIDWLRQFAVAFNEHTNLKHLCKNGKGPVVLVDPSRTKLKNNYVHIVKSWDEVPKNADVVLSTYQMFIREDSGAKRVKRHLSRFAFFIVDEVHKVAAEAYSRLMNNLDAYAKMGLTATVERADYLSFLVKEIMGEVVAASYEETILPKIELFETGIKTRKYSMTNAGWQALNRFLFNNAARNQMIVDQVMEDLRSDPRNCIIVPVTQLKHSKTLVDMINNRVKEAERNGERFGVRHVVAEFNRKSDRDYILGMASSGKIRVIVAIRSMVTHALSVPAWTHIYVGISPTSNGPMFYQLVKRVCTHYKGKPKAYVRFILDHSSAGVACFKKLWYTKTDGILQGLHTEEDRPRRWTISSQTYGRITEILTAGADGYVPQPKYKRVKRSITVNKDKPVKQSKRGFGSIKSKSYL